MRIKYSMNSLYCLTTVPNGSYVVGDLTIYSIDSIKLRVDGLLYRIDLMGNVLGLESIKLTKSLLNLMESIE